MSEKDNYTKETSVASSAKGGAMGLADFSMSSVRATETKEATEFTFRLWRLLTWLILLVVFTGVAFWWITDGRNFFWRPGIEDEQFLVQLSGLKPAIGLLQDYSFDKKDTIRFNLAPGVSVHTKEEQPKIREAVRALVATFSNYRPEVIVHVKGYEAGLLVAEGMIQESKKTGAAPTIWVHLEGEEKGIGEHRIFD